MQIQNTKVLISRYFKIFQNISRYFMIFQDISRYFEIFQIFQDVSRYFKIFQDILRYFNIFHDISRYFKIFQDISRYFKIFQDILRYFKTPHFRDISVTNNKFLSSISNLIKATIKDDIAVLFGGLSLSQKLKPENSRIIVVFFLYFKYKFGSYILV